MSDRADRLELITRLEGHAGTAAAVEEIKAQRELYEKNLGRELVRGSGPIKQSEIDFKRGFWYGALWAHTAFIRKADTDLEAEVTRAIEQREGGS
jgi:hypothetical protein